MSDTGERERCLMSAWDRRAIVELEQRWLDAERRGDTEALERLCSPQVRFIAPGGLEVAGRRAVRTLYGDSGVLVRDVELSDVRLEGSGCVAWKTARYQTRWLDPDSGEQGVARGVHMWVLGLEQGEWRVKLVTWHPEG